MSKTTLLPGSSIRLFESLVSGAVDKADAESRKLPNDVLQQGINALCSRDDSVLDEDSPIHKEGPVPKGIEVLAEAIQSLYVKRYNELAVAKVAFYDLGKDLRSLCQAVMSSDGFTEEYLVKCFMRLHTSANKREREKSNGKEIETIIEIFNLGKEDEGGKRCCQEGRSEDGCCEESGVESNKESCCQSNGTET